MAAPAATQALTETELRNLAAVSDVHPFWNRGDVDGVLEFYDDEITWTNVALDEVYRGKAEVGVFLGALFRALPDLVFTAPDAIARGDKVAEKWRIRGTHRGTLFGLPPTGRTLVIEGASMI